MNPFQIARKTKKPLLLDGAMGSLMQQRGAKRDKHLWMSKANLDNPELVLNLHQEYISAGADIITTNTFRTNPSVANLSGISSEILVKKAVGIAKEAVQDRDVLIAGSNAPAEDCYQKERTLSSKELEYNHQKHIKLLVENGADLILNETQSHLDEIKIISEFCTNNNYPYIISIFSTDGVNLLDNSNLKDTVNLIVSYKPHLISFNCISPHVFHKILGTINLTFNWGVYMNLGSGIYTDDKITASILPDKYKETIKNVFEFNPSLVGACCGSTPNHIKKLRELIDE